VRTRHRHAPVPLYLAPGRRATTAWLAYTLEGYDRFVQCRGCGRVARRNEAQALVWFSSPASVEERGRAVSWNRLLIQPASEAAS
jgi:hypothetical protein